VEFHQHIETRLGDIWIADAETNGSVKLESESRQDYEARFLQLMLEEIVGEAELDHKSNGAPFLKNRPNTHISISHSDHWFAIYLSKKEPIGIDIEIPSDHIKKTEQYFLTDSEIEQLQPTTEELAICWGIKESVFKFFRGNITSMKEDIQITSIEKNQAEASANQEVINLNYAQSEAFTLVYTNFTFGKSENRKIEP
jgi:phosphopantetheinyl transferase